MVFLTSGGTVRELDWLWNLAGNRLLIALAKSTMRRDLEFQFFGDFFFSFAKIDNVCKQNFFLLSFRKLSSRHVLFGPCLFVQGAFFK